MKQTKLEGIDYLCSTVLDYRQETKEQQKIKKT